MAYENILVSIEAGVATLTFNRPESRNAMTPAMGEEVVRAVQDIAADDSVRVFVLTGSGKAFSSGGDLSMISRDTGVTTQSDAPSMAGSPRDFYKRYLAVRSLPMPTIAAINGHAIGAGLCVAMACDMRIAVADAKMGMTFTRLGIHPGMGGTYFLPRLVGTARAAELIFSGRIFDAREAEGWGLLNRVVAREQFAAEVRALATEIAAAAPVAVRMAKKSLYRGVEHGLEDMLDYESLNQGLTFGTADAREGVTAMMEKRPARFTGH